MAVCKLGPLVPRVIDDRHAEGLEPARDGDADAPHADEADGAVAQRRPAQRIIAFRPFAGAQITLGLRQLADCQSSRPSVVSATSSVSTSGVWVTTMPRLAAALASMWS